jgi:excisionase family DNA binding protein
MDKLYRIGKAAQLLGVSVSTLRRWEREGKLMPHRTEGKHRLYRLSQFKTSQKSQPTSRDRKTIAYARVSSHDQKTDLERQKKVLEMYCASHGCRFELLADFGSGMNYYKKGLKKLLSAILEGNVGRLVLTHKDRLLRFGAELVFALCEAREVEVVIINSGHEVKFEEELAKDVLEIITVFSARLYGSRSRKNQKLLDGMKQVVDDVTRT